MLPRSFQEKVNLTQKLEYHYRASTIPDFEISGYLGQKIGQSYLRSFLLENCFSRLGFSSLIYGVRFFKKPEVINKPEVVLKVILLI